MSTDGPGLAAVAVGSVFIYAGIKGYSVLKAAQNAIQGQSPNAGQSTSLLVSNSGVPSTSSATSSISNNALQWTGKLTYKYGGPPPSGTVDCSSFASKVLDESGIVNPGGTPYSSTSHGPTTLDYLTWSGAKTISHNANDAIAGDLCVWQTHMGIAIGNGKMVSARDPSQGVGIDSISGNIPGEMLFVRRIK